MGALMNMTAGERVVIFLIRFSPGRVNVMKYKRASI